MQLSNFIVTNENINYLQFNNESLVVVKYPYYINLQIMHQFYVALLVYCMHSLNSSTIKCFPYNGDLIILN